MNIHDIAKIAGVSHTTVSKVINNTGSISDETKRRVLDIIKAHNYYPSAAARQVSRGRGEEIAFISTKYASPYISRVIEGAEDRSYSFGKMGRTLCIYSTRGSHELKREVLTRLVRGFQAQAVILLFVKPEPDLVKLYQQAGIPLVLIESSMPGMHSIILDNVNAAYDATCHLLACGRRKIGLIRGEIDFQEVGPTPAEREKGYKKALAEYGVAFNPHLVLEVSSYSFEEGKKGLDRLRSREPGLDAIFSSAGDMCALGVMERARELKIQIPKQLALIGFDDVVTAALAKPSLSTMRLPSYEIGGKAFEMAVDAAEGRLKSPLQMIIRPELILRESTPTFKKLI